MSVLLIWAAIHFDSFFVTFHRIAFRNTLWVLNPRESLLIRLMPETLFIRLGLWGTGILAVLTAGLLLCFRKRRPTAGKEDPES